MNLRLSQSKINALLEIIDFAMTENATRLEIGFLDTYTEDSAQRIQDNATKLARLINRQLRKGRK